MLPRTSRFAIMTGAVLCLTALGVTGAASALARPFQAGAQARPDQAAARGTARVNLAARMLTTSDLPSGFQPYEPLTGPLDTSRAEKIGGSVAGQVAGLLHGWVRCWIDGQTDQEVYETVWDAGVRHGATEASGSFESSVVTRGATRLRIAPHLTGYAYTVAGQSGGHAVTYVVVGVPFGRGPFLFDLNVLAPQTSSAATAFNLSLLAELVAAQDRKVPADTPDTGTSLADLQADPYNAAGEAVGVVLGYLAIASGVGYLRDPLRRGRRRDRLLALDPDASGPHVVDVSGRARRHRATARWRMIVQLAGLSLIAIGSDPYLVSNWFVFILAGAAVAWAGGRFIQPAGLRGGRNPAVLHGARRLRVTLLMSLATVLVVASAPLLMAYGLNQSEPQVVQTANAIASGLPPQTMTALAWAGVFLVAAGAAVSRLARRLAAVDARQLVQRDDRPPVLYLRSFGDDALKMRSATFGRRSLLERFTPRRFDAFEEVIARHFAAVGPVVAVNPPGTTLPPLGAARETLDPVGWEATVAEWMRVSAAIVFVAPPGTVTPGLAWELQQVSVSQYWDKAMILVPPVRAAVLRPRWQAFLAAFDRIWPFTVPLPLAVPSALVLTFRNEQWTAIRAARRDEWAYGAAIQEAAAVRSPAATAAPA